MQNAKGDSLPHRGRARLLFAFCILHLAFLSRAKRPPSAPQPTAKPQPDSITQLRQDILGAVNGPGVTRGAWGIAVFSLDRQARLFDLNPRTLLVPASSAKIVTVATAAEAAGWSYRYVTT